MDLSAKTCKAQTHARRHNKWTVFYNVDLKIKCHLQVTYV